MYKEYEQKMERLARILKIVKRVVIVLTIVVPVVLAYFFFVGIQYRAMECDSVVYGQKPEPKAYFTTRGEIVYEYRRTGAEDSEWSEEVPTVPGEYEVRASLVSALGVKKESTTTFTIRAKELSIRLDEISVYDDPHTGTVTEDNYEISGLEYDDLIQNVRVQIDETDSDIYLNYHLEDLQIVHADGTDAMDCYIIPEKTAQIRDARVSITVTAGSRTMMYNGDPNAFRDYDEWKITSGALKAGHTAEFHCAASDKGQWHTVNKIVSGGIKDEEGNSVDYQYIITYEDGELDLTQRTLILTSGSATKWYDGTPLTNPEYTIGGDGLAEGDTLHAECIGTVTEPAKVPNEFSEITVTSERFGDVTEYYIISTEEGILKVLLRVDAPANTDDSVFIGYGDGSEEVPDDPNNRFDGESVPYDEEIEQITLEFDEYGYLLPGVESTDPNATEVDEIIEIDPTAESTLYIIDEDGSTVAVYDPEGGSTIPFLDPTADSTIYGSEGEEGTTVAVYDPTAESTLFGEGETDSDGKRIDPTAESTIYGDEGETDSDGKRIDPTAESTLYGGDETDADGNKIDPTAESSMPGDEGTTADAGEPTEQDGGETTEASEEGTKPSDDDDDPPLNINDKVSPSFGFKSGQPKKVFSFYGFSNRVYYFKIFSYGLYNGQSFTKVSGESAYEPWCNYLMGNAILDSGYGYRDIVRVKDLAINYTVYPYSMTSDLTKSEDSKLYTSETQFLWAYNSYPVSSDSREKDYRQFVHSAYMGVPANVKEKLLELGKEAGLREGDPDLIDKIAEYIQNSATYSFKFSFPANKDMAIYFLTEGKKGICQHFATAGTLMYRAYGIPARFVVGYATQGEPGRWTTVTTNEAHAWVEIYIDGSGWIPVEVTPEPQFDMDDSDSGELQFDFGGMGGAEVNDTPFISIVYDRYKKVYDGKKGQPLVLKGHLYMGRLYDGDKLTMPAIEVKDEDVLDHVGDNYFEVNLDQIHITDRDGNDVTDQYMIELSGARYIVEARPLSIIVYGDYGENNSLWRMKKMQWSIADGSLASGHTLEVYCDDRDGGEDNGFAYTLGNVGDYKICARILDEEGNNVTYNYDLYSPVIMATNPKPSTSVTYKPAER